MVPRYLTLDSQHVHPPFFKCSVVITLFSVWCNFLSIGSESFCWDGREKVMWHKRGFLNNKFVNSRSWPICFLRGGGRNIFICLCIVYFPNQNRTSMKARIIFCLGCPLFCTTEQWQAYGKCSINMCWVNELYLLSFMCQDLFYISHCI